LPKTTHNKNSGILVPTFILQMFYKMCAGAIPCAVNWELNEI
jgi:hypothetical protein